jgi:hypothetical protein
LETISCRMTRSSLSAWSVIAFGNSPLDLD